MPRCTISKLCQLQITSSLCAPLQYLNICLHCKFLVENSRSQLCRFVCCLTQQRHRHVQEFPLNSHMSQIRWFAYNKSKDNWIARFDEYSHTAQKLIFMHLLARNSCTSGLCTEIQFGRIEKKNCGPITTIRIENELNGNDYLWFTLALVR